MSLNASYGVFLRVNPFYGVAVTADSGSINGGLVERSDPAVRGQSMAMYAALAAPAFFFTSALWNSLRFGWRTAESNSLNLGIRRDSNVHCHRPNHLVLLGPRKNLAAQK
jgi:hypothetical protein